MEESDSDSDSEKAWSYDATQVTKPNKFSSVYWAMAGQEKATSGI